MANPIKVLVVDDEPEARELLSYILREKPGIAVIGSAGHVDEALSLCNKEKPELVFLDIQMPGKDGFEFIEQVQELGETPGIIFVTAYEHYAIQAIRNSVFDYIMKPVREEELGTAIERFRLKRNRVRKKDMQDLIEAFRQGGPEKVKLNTRTGYVLLEPSEVVYCRADGNYTHLVLSNGEEELTTQNLSSIEALLEGRTFFRASRSYLLNLKYLRRVDRKSCQCYLEYPGHQCAIKIPAPKIRLLESSFTG